MFSRKKCRSQEFADIDSFAIRRSLKRQACAFERLVFPWRRPATRSLCRNDAAAVLLAVECFRENMLRADFIGWMFTALQPHDQEHETHPQLAAPERSLSMLKQDPPRNPSEPIRPVPSTVFHRASPCRRAERVRGIKQAGHATALDPMPGVGNEKPVSHGTSAREATALRWFMKRNDHSNCSSRSVRSGSTKEKLPRLSARQSASSAKTAIIHPVFAWRRSCQ